MKIKDPSSGVTMKATIERGASWTLEETKVLLSIWGEDLIQRQSTNAKRDKGTYDKISEKLNLAGYERTTDQVRTRIFNMIAEYRRLTKKPDPVRLKKCFFFEALKRIYQAKTSDDVHEALENYRIDEYPHSPNSNMSESEMLDSDVDTEINSSNASNNAVAVAVAVAATAGANSTTTNTTTSGSNLASVLLSSSAVSCVAKKEPNAQLSTITGPSTKKQRTDSSTTTTDVASLATPSNLSALVRATTPDSNSNSKASCSNQQSLTQASTSTNISTSTIPTNLVGVRQQGHQSLLLANKTTASHGYQSTTPNQQTNSVHTSKKAPTTATPTSLGSNTFFNLNPGVPIIRANIGHPNSTLPNADGLNGATRLPTTAITSHQLYQAPITTFDVTSSALLIDRMFAHLSRESDNMREWIALEKERLSLERARRQQENERELRREKALVDTLIKFQEQWLSFVSHLDPRVVAAAQSPTPKLNNIPPD